MKLPDKIKTERLNIYPMDFKFVKEMFAEFTPEITKYMSDGPAKDITQQKEWIQWAIDKNVAGRAFLVYFTDKNDNWIGNGGLYKIYSKTPEFGIWIKESAQGNRYGYEAIQALKEWCDKNLEYDYLLYQVEERNMASRIIAEKLGGKVTDCDTSNVTSKKDLKFVEYRIYK